MEHNTNQETQPTTTLRAVYDSLGPRNTMVKDALKILDDKGLKCSKASAYQTIEGRSNRREVVDALLEAAEAELERRRQVDTRARQLVEQAEAE